MALLAHGAVGICPLELLGLVTAVSSAGGVSVLWGILKLKLGLG
jgi:hypothetical protein